MICNVEENFINGYTCYVCGGVYCTWYGSLERSKTGEKGKRCKVLRKGWWCCLLWRQVRKQVLRYMVIIKSKHIQRARASHTGECLPAFFLLGRYSISSLIFWLKSIFFSTFITLTNHPFAIQFFIKPSILSYVIHFFYCFLYEWYLLF